MKECVIFGGLLQDKYYQVQSLPKRGQDGFINGEFQCVGGCAVNMAVTFNNLGGNAHVVSYIGTDETGRDITDYMKTHDLSLRYVAQKDGVTGYCMVFLEADGERTFLTKIGMELEFSKKILKEGLGDIKYAAVTGYFLLNDGAEKIVEVLEEFSRNGGYILFDPSPLVDSIEANILKRMLAISSVITPNTSEITLLAECDGQSADDKAVQKWIKGFVAEGGKVILKEGAAGGSVYTKKGKESYTALKTAVVDTTGAGDSFAAGLLFGIASELPIGKAIELGTHTASVVVSINGPHGFWKPNEAMNKILEEKQIREVD